MTSLVCLRLQLPCTRSSTPWMKRCQQAQYHTAKNNPYNPLLIPCSTKAVTLPHAGAKGFGVPVPDKYLGQEEAAAAAPSSSSSSCKKNKNNGGDDEEDAIPQVVFERMLARIAFYVGTPMVLGVGLMYLLGKLKEQNVWEAPTWLPLLTILLAFGTSALGIAYGILSTSWDPDKEGTLLGWEEAQKNWPELWKEEPKTERDD